MNETLTTENQSDTTRQATPVEKLFDDVVWKEVHYEVEPSMVSDTLTHITHQGILDFCGTKFRVYQLSSGERVIDAEDVKEFFGYVE